MFSHFSFSFLALDFLPYHVERMNLEIMAAFLFPLLCHEFSDILFLPSSFFLSAFSYLRAVHSFALFLHLFYDIDFPFSNKTRIVWRLRPLPESFFTRIFANERKRASWQLILALNCFELEMRSCKLTRKVLRISLGKDETAFECLANRLNN